MYSPPIFNPGIYLPKLWKFGLRRKVCLVLIIKSERGFSYEKKIQWYNQPIKTKFIMKFTHQDITMGDLQPQRQESKYK